jgi:hypothetical protein
VSCTFQHENNDLPAPTKLYAICKVRIVDSTIEGCTWRRNHCNLVLSPNPLVDLLFVAIPQGLDATDSAPRNVAAIDECFTLSSLRPQCAPMVGIKKPCHQSDAKRVVEVFQGHQRVMSIKIKALIKRQCIKNPPIAKVSLLRLNCNGFSCT